MVLDPAESFVTAATYTGDYEVLEDLGQVFVSGEILLNEDCTTDPCTWSFVGVDIHGDVDWNDLVVDLTGGHEAALGIDSIYGNHTLANGLIYVDAAVGAVTNGEPHLARQIQPLTLANSSVGGVQQWAWDGLIATAEPPGYLMSFVFVATLEEVTSGGDGGP